MSKFAQKRGLVLSYADFHLFYFISEKIYRILVNMITITVIIKCKISIFWGGGGGGGKHIFQTKITDFKHYFIKIKSDFMPLVSYFLSNVKMSLKSIIFWVKSFYLFLFYCFLFYFILFFYYFFLNKMSIFCNISIAQEIICSALIIFFYLLML